MTGDKEGLPSMGIDRWSKITLRDANVTLIDCDHRTPPACDAGYPYIAIPQLKEGRIDLTNVRRIASEHYQDWTRKAKPCANDVILSRRCNPGETAIVPPNLEFALGQNLVLLRADGTRVYPPFLRWLVRGPEWWDQIEKYLNAGAVFDSLKCADVPNFELTIPPIPIQRRIAHILGSLDDKIELNRQINETLEAMARAIFKSWFVDFDPVRAKVEGRQPAGMDAETAALFPDGFEEVDGREVPKGWKFGKVSDLVGINEKSLSCEYPHTQIEYIEISSVTKGKLEASITVSLEAAPSRAQRLVSHGDTIWSGVRPNRESYLFIQHPNENLVVSTGFVVLTPHKIPPTYLFSWVTTENFVDYLTANADGSAYPAVRAEHFGNADLLIPSKEILAEFERIVAPMREKIHQNEQQSRTLGQIRDALLPKLMSGEIRVDADKS
jgi:type I restriction enzyme S subunit